MSGSSGKDEALSTPSIYIGADIKLEAFDCFHKVLNECHNSCHFSIHDAAALLKHLSPDILRKIIPLISLFKKVENSKKQVNLDNSPFKLDLYERGVDAEVSQINESQKDNMVTASIQPKTLIKRPDASRPTRMLSPGSNCCSPVSAAVQALISISAPVTDKTETQTNSFCNKTMTIVENVYNKPEDEENSGEVNMVSCDNMFVPVSKPSNVTTSDFLDSAFASVPKAGQNNPYEVDEVLFMSKSNQSSVNTLSMNSITNSINHSITSGLTNTMACDFTSDDKRNFETFKQSSSLIPPDDPLPNFGLLLNSTGMPSEIPCNISFPFSQQLAGSPVHASVSSQGGSYYSNTSNGIPNPTAILLSTFNQSQQASLSDCTNQEVKVLPNSTVSTNELQINKQTFRTILPKPSDGAPISNITSVVSVLPPTALSSNINVASQLQQVIKMDDKIKNHHLSVPPSQIFTKINSNGNSSLSSVSQFISQQQKALLSNPNYFFPPMENNVASSESALNQKTIIRKDVPFGDTKLLPNSAPKLPKMTNFTSKTLNNKKESGGGNLEVVSALLSMGETNNKTYLRNILELVNLSLEKSGKSDLTVAITESGNLKIANFEIDPTKHVIEEDNFTCGKCGRVFTSIIYLIRHIKRVCPDMSQRKWKCDRCTKAFSHPFGLQQHIYTHTGERPHQCKQCTKAFYSANDLRRHGRTHSGERPYKCEVCEKAFSTTISLRTHSYTHTGERPHKCPNCVKTFSTSSKLSRHLITHSDKRPFPCDQCEKKFNRSGDLRRHYKQLHGLSPALLECNQCHKVFATKQGLITHKLHHASSGTPQLPNKNIIILQS